MKLIPLLALAGLTLLGACHKSGGGGGHTTQPPEHHQLSVSVPAIEQGCMPAAIPEILDGPQFFQALLDKKSTSDVTLTFVWLDDPNVNGEFEYETELLNGDSFVYFDPAGRLGAFAVEIKAVSSHEEPWDPGIFLFEVVPNTEFLDVFFTKAEVYQPKTFVVGDNFGSGGLGGTLFFLDQDLQLVESQPFFTPLGENPTPNWYTSPFEATGYVFACLDDGRVSPIRSWQVLDTDSNCSVGVQFNGYTLHLLQPCDGQVVSWPENQDLSGLKVWMVYEDGFIDAPIRVNPDGSYTHNPTHVGTCWVYVGGPELLDSQGNLLPPVLPGCGNATSVPYSGIDVLAL